MTNKIKKYFSALDYNTKEMISGASVSFVFRMFGAFVQFALSVVIARKYGADGVGVYSISLMVATISSTIGRWGMDQAALKYIAIAVGDTGQIRAIFQNAFVVISSVSLIVSGLVYFSAPILALSVFHDASLLQPLKYMSLSILPFSLLNLYAECLRASKKIAWYSLVQGVLVSSVALLMLLLVFFREDDVIGAVFSYVAACFVVMIFGAFVWSSLIPSPWKKSRTFWNDKENNLFTTANSMAWIGIVSILMGFSETLILGVFKSTEDVGLYSASLRLAMLMSMIIFAFNSILAPKFAALHAQGLSSELQSLARKSIAIMLMAELPFLIVYLFFPEYVLYFFGETFTRAAPALQILVLGQLINVGAGPVAAMLTMSGFEKNVRMIVVFSSLLSLMLGMVLIPAFGIIGAAWTATVGMLILTLMASLSVRRNLNIKVPF